VSRLAPILCPPTESKACQKQGSFPPPELPGFIGTTIPSAAPDSPAWLSRDAGWSRSSGSTAGVSRVPCAFLCMHVVTITPASPMKAVRSYSSISSGLPRCGGGSAPALQFSRPSWCLLHYNLHARRAAKRPFTSKVPTALFPPLPLRLLPVGANQFPDGSSSR